jgi:hypothetical protein
MRRDVCDLCAGAGGRPGWMMGSMDLMSRSRRSSKDDIVQWGMTPYGRHKQDEERKRRALQRSKQAEQRMASPAGDVAT